jgi:hypothetical protein
VALPKQLKSARMSNSTLASSIDDNTNALEQDLADILGLPLNTDIGRAQRKQVEYAQITDSTVITGVATETSFSFNFATFPANSFKVGDVIRVSAVVETNNWNGTDALTLGVHVGTGVPNKIVWWLFQGAVSTAYVLEAAFIVRAIGFSGQIQVLAASALVGPATNPVKPTFLVAPSYVVRDTTTTVYVFLSAQHGSASADNQTKMVAFAVEVLPAASSS